MNPKKFLVMLLLTIVALPLLTGALFGPPRLVVKPEAVSRVDERLARMTLGHTFSGSVLIAFGILAVSLFFLYRKEIWVRR